MATGRAVIKQALDKLSTTLDPEDKRFFLDTTVGDLWKEARTIEHEQGQRKDLRFMRRIEGFLRTMETYSGVIEVFCQGFSPMAFVWGPIKLLLLVNTIVNVFPSLLADELTLQLAQQYDAVMDKVLQAYSDIADVMPRLDKLKAAFGDSPDFQQVLGLIYSDILEFHQRAYKMFRRKSWQVWFALDWGHFERRFKSILQRLASHCDLMDKEAAATHFIEMKAMWEKRQLEEERYEEQRNHQLTRETLSWLSADEDAQEDFLLHRLADQRQPGTCDWILSEPMVMAWLEDDFKDPVVWVTGIPGAGKSFLCSLVVQNSELQHSRSTAYYFCGQKPSNADPLASLLRTVTVQLLRQNLDLGPLIHQAYLQKGSGPSCSTIKKVLKEILVSAKPLRIVLDGIDEWNPTPQRETLKALVELQRHGGNNSKLLICSRREPLISKAIPNKVHLHIDGQSANGLNRYILSNTEELRERFSEFAPAVWERVKHEMQVKANGMFLWVRLVKTMLEGCSSEDDFESQIGMLPDGLDEAYDRILTRLKRLDPSRKERALRVLFWICRAFRSLTIDEVVDGIALKPGHTTLTPKTRSQNPERDILELLAPMLEKTSSGKLDVVHFSVKEYLLHMKSGPFIDPSESHSHITFACIVNLTSALVLVPSLSGPATDMDVEGLVVRGSYGLQSYAHHYWMEHLAAHLEFLQAPDAVNPRLLEALCGFCEVLKGRSSSTIVSDPSAQQQHMRMHKFQKLQGFPAIIQLIYDWSQFKSRLAESASKFETLDAREQFLLQHDQTYLSLIDQRLREVTEQLLIMDRRTLPGHIQQSEFEAFVARFAFCCRAEHCSHNFPSMQERDAHESSHNTSFPCLQCDFSEIGFRTREGLRKHTQRYHMSPDDFDVPQSLQSCYESTRFVNVPGARHSSNVGRSSQSWSEQGRKASQQSFQKILASVESEMLKSNSDSSQSDTCDPVQSPTSMFQPLKETDAETLRQGFSTIREGIKEQHYNTLYDFKYDVGSLLRKWPLSSSSAAHSMVHGICEEELGKLGSGFPDFAEINSKNHRSLTGFRHTGRLSDRAGGHSEDGSIKTGVQDHLHLRDRQMRNTYWSLTEEKQLPDLLTRHGCDPVKIADCLKTKTMAEIEIHPLFSERLNKPPPPDAIEDVGAQSLSEAALCPAPREDALPGVSTTEFLMNHADQPDILPGDWWSGYGIPSSLTDSGLAVSERSARLSNLNPTKDGFVADDNEQGAQKAKKEARRPRARAKCNTCGYECYDQWVAVKHFNRAHVPNRKMWTCKDKDRSLSKSFFFPCKSCVTGKLYASERNAMKHLRSNHFPNNTPEQTLHRWMEQTEGPNPNYRNPDPEAPPVVRAARVKTSYSTELGTSGRAEKRRKVGQLAPIRHPHEPDSDTNRLPAIRTMLSGADSASGGHSPEPQANESDESSEDSGPTAPQELGMFPDVSFDILLPAGDSSISISDDPIKSLNKPWIRPS